MGWHGQKVEEENSQLMRNAVAWWVSGLLQNHLANGVGVQTGWQMEGNVRPLEFSFLIEATSHGEEVCNLDQMGVTVCSIHPPG